MSRQVTFTDPVVTRSQASRTRSGVDYSSSQSGRELTSVMISQKRDEFLDDLCFLTLQKMTANIKTGRQSSTYFREMEGTLFHREFLNSHIDLTPRTREEIENVDHLDPTDKDRYEAPSNYDKAFDCEDEYCRVRWRRAIKGELSKMDSRTVWLIMLRADMPPNRRCVKHKWIFEIKRSGRFKARLVACGYSQIPGVDHEEVYSPVINDVTYRIMLVCAIIYKYVLVMADVETAFLYGDLDEEIYMECPKGVKHEKGQIVKLLQTIYGLVQSARQFFKKFISILKSIGFVGGQIDPCLMMRKNDLGTVYIAMYVDDSLFMGDDKAIRSAIKEIQDSGFNMTVEETLGDYLSCNILFKKDKSKAWLGQPHLIKKLNTKFGEMVKKLQTYKTPGTPGVGVVRPEEVDVVITEEDQTLYRSGVGMLLYLVKHSRPDIANVTRELSKSMDRATPAAYKELGRVIKFVLDTRDYGIKIEPKMPQQDGLWNMVMYTDSDYAGDKDSRKSVSGFILFLMNVPVLWRSKAQKSVTLSSAEAEYVSLSEAAKEIKFVYQILITMGLKVKTPLVVRVDNIGASFMSENISTTSRSKHVDIRYKYVNEMVEEGFLKVIFVRSAENVADGFTKNISGDLYESHKKDYLAEKSYLGELCNLCLQEGCCGVQNQVPQVKENRVPEDLENGAGARRANCTLEPQTSRCHNLRTTGQNDLILTALKSSDQGLSNEMSLTSSSQESMEQRGLKVLEKVCKTLWFW